MTPLQAMHRRAQLAEARAEQAEAELEWRRQLDTKLSKWGHDWIRKELQRNGSGVEALAIGKLIAHVRREETE